MITFTFLSENKTENPVCSGEHGLSIYIEVHGKKILFDAGASDLFYCNAKKLGVDISSVDLAVISHGHYDHTQGIPVFCRENKVAPIYIHRNAFRKTYGLEDGKPEAETCGLRFDETPYRHRFILTEGVTKVDDHIVVSGTIEELPGIMPTERFYEVREDGTLIPDPMDHEQFLAIDTEKGIFLFSGCSHRGILPAIKYCKKIFPDRQIALLTAGLHLYGASRETILQTGQEILDEGVENIMPVHCTGLDAIVELKQQWGDRCILAMTGKTYGY